MQDSNALNFEFADKFGLQSGFENSEFNPSEEKYTSGDVQIIKLLKDLQPNAKLLDYTHSNYQALYISQYYGFEGRHTPPEKPAFSYTDKNGNTKSALFKAQLNTKPGQIDTSTTFQLKLNLSAKTKECNYQLSVPYYVELGATSTPASAVILETSDFEDLEYYIEISRGRIIDSFSKIVQRQFLSEINAYAGRANELKWLYERAPDFALDKRADEKLTKDLITLLNYDTEGWFWFFKDSSTAFIRCIEHIKDHFELFKYLAAQPELVYKIYRSLDKVSEWNNKLEENRMIFASIVDAICRDMGYYQLAYDNNEGPASFRVDNEHYVESFVLEDGDDNGGRIQLNQIEIQSFERSPLKVSEGGVDYEIEVQPRKDDVLIKSYFLNPLQLVELRNKEGKAEYHSALFIKALADNKKWDDIEHSIRIGVDIVGVTFSAITLGAGATPFWTAVAVADLALMGSDLILDGIRPEIEKLEHGPEFLEIWDSIYYTGGAITGIVTTPALIQSLGRMARLATLLLKTASKGTQNFLKVAIVTAALDRGITNFTKSTTRVLFSASEVSDASADILQERSIQRMMDGGLIFGMDDLMVGEVVERNFFVVFEGNAIAAGTAKEIRKALKPLKGKHGIDITKTARAWANDSPDAVSSLWQINRLNGKKNCANVALATDRTLAGTPTSALPNALVTFLTNKGPISIYTPNFGTPLFILENIVGSKFVKMTLEEIRGTLKPGQRGIVHGRKYGKRITHVFNVINENGIVKFLDSQPQPKDFNSFSPHAKLIYDEYELLPTNFKLTHE